MLSLFRHLFPVILGPESSCYRLLIEVSQQDEEQGRAKRKGKMLELEKKNNYCIFYLWI